MALPLKPEDEIKFSNIYAVESLGWGLIRDFIWKGGFHLGKSSEVVTFLSSDFYCALSFYSKLGIAVLA